MHYIEKPMSNFTYKYQIVCKALFYDSLFTYISKIGVGQIPTFEYL